MPQRPCPPNDDFGSFIEDAYDDQILRDEIDHFNGRVKIRQVESGRILDVEEKQQMLFPDGGGKGSLLRSWTAWKRRVK